MHVRFSKRSQESSRNLSERPNIVSKATKYKRKGGLLPLLEVGFAFYFLLAIFYAIHMRLFGTIPFLCLFFFGYGYMGVMSMLQSLNGGRLQSFFQRPALDKRV